MHFQKAGASFRFAFVKTIPILFTYVFLGAAYGITLHEAGYGPAVSLLTSLIIYTGAFEFALIPLLAAAAPLVTIFLTALFMGSRHLFYGLSFIDKFKRNGKLRPYMIFTLTDEVYSVFVSAKYPNGVDEPTAMFFITLLSHFYWTFGSWLGGMAGMVLPIDFTGVDFCMTAFFLCVVLDQWKAAGSKLPALIGICSGVAFLLLLGANNFILPALMVTAALLILLRKPIEAGMAKTAPKTEGGDAE